MINQTATDIDRDAEQDGTLRIWRVEFPTAGGQWRWRVATPRHVVAEGRSYDEDAAIAAGVLARFHWRSSQRRQAALLLADVERGNSLL